ncbi:hypothetical protein Ahy_A09g042745 [Arachis hypogaea]|uniref:Protein FAR1-RELATED SEQUENCE n=1 Tax=Arachis hypogaea TaxID=3818 RepID=A0A445BGR1_ARAHY|nr:hypothetical protein Ahy_A09g042745 [Arachis hypogaea]
MLLPLRTPGGFCGLSHDPCEKAVLFDTTRTRDVNFLYPFVIFFQKTFGDDVPIFGMEFESMDGVIQFYNTYGRAESNVDETRKTYPKGPTGCKAKMIAFSDVDGSWIVRIVEPEHYHDLSCTNSRCWVLVYLKGGFWVGISSTCTQRSESIHFLFGKYLNPQATLAEFITQYNNALMSRVKKKAAKDFESLNKVVLCCSNSEIKVQFQFKYTNDIFQKPHVKCYDCLRDHFSKVTKAVVHSEQYNDLLYNSLKEFCVGLPQNISYSDCGVSFNHGEKGISECGRVETDANLSIRSPIRCGPNQGEFGAPCNNVVFESFVEVIADQEEGNIAVTVCFNASISLIV